MAEKCYDRGASEEKSRRSEDQDTHSLIQYHPVYTTPGSQQSLERERGSFSLRR